MSKYNEKVRILFRLFLVLLLILSSLALDSNTVFAISANDTNANNATVKDDADYKAALKTAPRGLHWNTEDTANGDFVSAKFAGKAQNTAKVVNSNNPNEADLTSSEKTSVIQVTDGTNQVGAIWSNVNNGNYFDIDHDQTASMWLYFGQSDKNKYPGDGMAFVLHNDKRGVNAIAASDKTINKDGNSFTIKDLPADGQSLGVWGPDRNPNSISALDLSTKAIQNSWAIEFDTFLDNITQNIDGTGFSFDSAYNMPNSNSTNIKDRMNQHIAWNYPALPDAYILDSMNKGQHFFKLRHNGFHGNLNLVDSKWHHLTIKWIKPEPNSSIGYIDFSYNDKNPDGTPVPEDDIIRPSLIDGQTDVQRIPIDISKFNFDSNLKGDRKLYWGFTGSTGKYYENNLIIFESIPSFVDADATSSIHNDTSGKEINKKTDTVEPKDNLTFTYKIHYNGWTKSWNNIIAKIKEPKNIIFKSGHVDFKNAKDKSFDIDSSEFPNRNTEVTKDKETNLKFKINSNDQNNPLGAALSHDNDTAIVTLKGIAVVNPTPSENFFKPNVTSAHATFLGDNLITDTDTQEFNINPE